MLCNDSLQQQDYLWEFIFSFYHISAPPRIDLSLSTKVVYSYTGNHRRLQIKCYFWGFPIPRMKITKNKKALGNDNIKQEGQRLIVGFVKTEEESDFGAYVCEAENKLDKATHSVEIRQAGLLFTLRQFCHTVEPP